MLAHQENAETRNADYHKIVTELNKYYSANGTIFECMDCIILAGDLNYRVNGNTKIVHKVLKQPDMQDVLLQNDQLAIEKKLGNAFVPFQEGAIQFPPTYKYLVNSDQLDMGKKQRIPSFTDRVLFAHKQANPAALTLNTYKSMINCKTSDHRPVYAIFTVSQQRNKQVLLRQTESSVCNMM